MDDILHEIVHESQASSLSNRVNHYSTKLVLKGGTDAVHNGLLVEVSASLYTLVDEQFNKHVRSIAKPGDKAQMVLKTNTMESFISTPMRYVSDLTVDHLMTTVEKSQNSGATIRFSDNLVLEFIHIRLDKGWNLPGGVGREDLMYFNNHSQKRSCRRVAPVGKNSCLPACCIVGAAHEQMLAARKQEPRDENVLKAMTSRYRQVADHVGQNNELKAAVELLYHAAGIRHDSPCDLTHLPKFEEILNVSFKVVSIPDQLRIVYKGPKRADRDYVYLVYSKPEGAAMGHYDLITKVKGFFSKLYYCQDCDVAYSNIYDHRCKNTIEWWCFSCYDPKCTKSSKPKPCVLCNVKLHSKECKDRHLKFRCGERWRCPHCRKLCFRDQVYDPGNMENRFSTDEEMELGHDCNKYYCKECQEEVPNDHSCFVKRKEHKDKIQRVLYFDLETDQSSKTHEVTYIHVMNYEQTPAEVTWEENMQTLKAQVRKGRRKIRSIKKQLKYGNLSDEERQNLDWAINGIIREEIETDARLSQYETYMSDDTKWKGKWREHSYSGPDSLQEFCKDLVTNFANYTCIAHNLKGFDGIFILKTFLENGVIPEVICKGQKLLEIQVKHCNLRFIDSFNFLPMGLAKLPDAFGLDCGPKGYFPHFFNRPENQDYVGRYPDKKFYGVAQMSSGDREKFHKWYAEQEGQEFNFQEQMAEYCAQDVRILKESCMAYRRLMCSETSCDPFSYITLASVCSAVYMINYMPQNAIARVPPSGYHGAKYSSEGYEWVEYKRRHGGVPGLRHAMNGGEVRIRDFLVDGYDDDSKTIYEYYGCYYHGCPKCFSGELRNPDTNKRLRQAYVQTMKRESVLKGDGYKIVSVWGCEWKKEKQSNRRVARLVKEMNLPTALDPRDAFFGGRTECFKVWTRNGPIVYHDVTSLYPWVNSTMLYPVGHPEIILSDFKDISEYFGIVKCSILPPQDLYIPVLPMHAGPTKKLLFPLCRTCGENFQVSPCQHSEEERILHGTWFSEEIKLAMEKGYELKTIHTVWHFKETSTELFAPYMRTFYKKKLLSSNLPFSSRDEILNFIKDVKQKENITISDPDEFKENPGLRQITKLMLNNLWGRFGMNENMSKTQFVNDFEELEQLLEDITREIQGVRVINENTVQVISKALDREFLPCARDTNIFVAITTTAWARIRLYREMDKLKDRVIYCDTDSVVYEESPNPLENLTIGNFLGEMTSELDRDDCIEEFVSGGPKNYGYRTKKGKSVVKVKGFTLNSTNAPAFSFENIRKVILNGVCVPKNGDRSDPLPIKKRRLAIQAQRDMFLSDHLKNAEEASALAGTHGISVFNPVRIFRTRTWDVVQKAEQKLYSFYFDKRIIFSNFDTAAYGNK